MTLRVVDVDLNASAGLSASTVPENDYAVWSSAANYSRGDRVISTTTHRIYEAQRGSGASPDLNQNRNPTLASNQYHRKKNPKGWWNVVGATNRWRVFDNRLYDQAQQATSMQWTVLMSRNCDTVGVLNTAGGSVQCEVLSGGTPVSSAIISLSGSDAPLRRAVFLGLAATAGRSVRITVSGTGTQRVGEIVFGQIKNIGTALAGTEVGFRSFSEFGEDEYGNPDAIRRLRGETATVRARCDATDKDRILRILANQDAIPALYLIGDPNAGDGAAIYGYAEEPSIMMNTGNRAEFVLELLGRT